MEQSYLYITQVQVFVVAHLLSPFYPSVRPSRKGWNGITRFRSDFKENDYTEFLFKWEERIQEIRRNSIKRFVYFNVY